MATIISLTCKYCNNSFTVKKGRERQFCSNECKSKHRSERDFVFYVEKHCEYCDKIFKSKRKEKKKFCSYNCSGLNKKKMSREKRYCFECGNLFSERIKHKKNFCSETCRKKWQGKPENIKVRIQKTTEGVFAK